MKKSPVSLVAERFESKDKLVEAIGKLATEDLWLDRVNAAKGLARVANSKLLRLHDMLSDAKSRFGSRQKLVAAIQDLAKRTKDAGYQQRLENYSLPRLIDLHGSLSKRQSRAEQKSAAAAKPKVARVAKAPVKKAAAKKAAAKKAPAKKSGAKKAGSKKASKKGK